MKPSPALYVRLRFSTKDVGKGFYRGNRTGSMGAHTPKGGYLIDYRKVRSYKVPDLKNFKLTPYVTKEIGERETTGQEYWWEINNPHLYETTLTEDSDAQRRSRAMDFLKEWRIQNKTEFDAVLEHQESFLAADIDRSRNGDLVESIEYVKRAEQSR